MEKLNIVYLHGFGSDQTTQRGVELKKNFKEYNVIIPNLPVNPKKAINVISRILSIKGNYILVGTSLGGFYADYFNKLADVPCILINPLIDIRPMKRHIGMNKNYNSGIEFEYTKEDFNDLTDLYNKKNKLGYSDSPEYIIVAKDDELCDWEIARNTFINDTHWLQVVPSGGHRFTGVRNTKLLVNTIKELIADIDGYNFSSLHNKAFESISFEKKKMIINEHYVNLLKRTDKEKYFDEISQLIHDTYEYIGGYTGNIRDFLDDKYFWKLIRKDGQIIAGRVYKLSVGRKSICAFTNGTPMGKAAIKLLFKEDLERAWVETSSKSENVYKYTLNETPLPHELVKVIMNLINKEVISWDEDGYHYTRIIKGAACRKAIYGKIQKK